MLIPFYNQALFCRSFNIKLFLIEIKWLVLSKFAYQVYQFI